MEKPGTRGDPPKCSLLDALEEEPPYRDTQYDPIWIGLVLGLAAAVGIAILATLIFAAAIFAAE